MPRFTNRVSGSVVNVSDAEAEHLGPEYSPTKDKAAADDKPRSESPDASWKVAELKAHAEENGIDLGEATKKEDILTVITSASNPE